MGHGLRGVPGVISARTRKKNQKAKKKITHKNTPRLTAGVARRRSVRPRELRNSNCEIRPASTPRTREVGRLPPPKGNGLLSGSTYAGVMDASRQGLASLRFAWDLRLLPLVTPWLLRKARILCTWQHLIAPLFFLSNKGEIIYAEDECHSCRIRGTLPSTKRRAYIMTAGRARNHRSKLPPKKIRRLNRFYSRPPGSFCLGNLNGERIAHAAWKGWHQGSGSIVLGSNWRSTNQAVTQHRGRQAFRSGKLMAVPSRFRSALFDPLPARQIQLRLSPGVPRS